MVMNLDKWINPHTLVSAGTNGPLGTPRGWVSRAIEQSLFSDSQSLKTDTTLDHREISCGAVFPRGTPLPDFGSQRALYRFFSIPKGYAGKNAGGGRARDYQEEKLVIGVALALDPKDFLRYEKMLKAAGAEWIWFSIPIPIKHALPQRSSPRKNCNYDYEEIYKLFDQGLKVSEVVAKIDGASQPAVSYIRKRWEKGEPPVKRKKSQVGLNHEEILSDYKSGMPVEAIADKHDATRPGIYHVLKRYDIDYRNKVASN